jgi:hypothetical protein
LKELQHEEIFHLSMIKVWILCLTLGSKGANYSKGKEIVKMPAIKNLIKLWIRAGDALSGFHLLILRSKTIKECLDIA